MSFPDANRRQGRRGKEIAVETFLADMYWVVAILFSIMFAWQLLATLLGGIGGTENVDMSGGHDIAGGGHDVSGSGHDAGAVHGADSVASFKLLSVRSVSAFGLLFGWAGVLYLKAGTDANWTIAYSLLWGAAGMVVVAAVFYFLTRLAETGTHRIASAVGERGTVYMDIPAGGTGQIRVMVSGTVSFVNARVAGGETLKAGTPVVVKRVLAPDTVEVEKVQS